MSKKINSPNCPPIVPRIWLLALKPYYWSCDCLPIINCRCCHVLFGIIKLGELLQFPPMASNHKVRWVNTFSNNYYHELFQSKSWRMPKIFFVIVHFKLLTIFKRGQSENLVDCLKLYAKNILA